MNMDFSMKPTFENKYKTRTKIRKKNVYFVLVFTSAKIKFSLIIIE